MTHNATKAIWAYLSRHSNAHGIAANVSWRDIAKATGHCTATVSKAVKELRSLGYVTQVAQKTWRIDVFCGKAMER